MSPPLAVSCCLLRVSEAEASPVLDVAGPAFPWSACFSPTLYGALQDSLAQTRTPCDMAIPSEFPRFNGCEEIFVLSNFMGNLTHF